MKAEPLLRWVGGKTRLLPDLRARLPERFGRYFEPFAGGAALFFDLAPERAVLGDANADLMAMYRTVACDVEGVIGALMARATSHAADPDGYYYETRAHWNARSSSEPISRASALLYLNRCCFNGLWRTNKKGGMNSPMGRDDEGRPLAATFDLENLRAASVVLRRAELRPGDFRECVRDAEAGDLVYFDPPYVPVAKTANFTAYAAGGFGPEYQRDLGDLVRSLVDRSVHVLVSNSDTPLVREIYEGMQVDTVQCDRRVNSKGGKRGKVAEVIVVGRPRAEARAA